MRKLSALSLVLCFLGFLGLAEAKTQESRLAKLESLARSPEMYFIPGEAVVKFPPRVSEAIRRAISQGGKYDPRALGVRTQIVSIEPLMKELVRDDKLLEIGADRVYHIVFGNSIPATGWDLEVEEAWFNILASELETLGAVVEKDNIQWSHDLPLEFKNLPNDALLEEQWHLERMNVFSLWEMGITGSKKVKYFVIDSDVFGGHEDLSPVFNVLDSRIFVGGPGDSLGHGSLVAGTCCATGNNGIGGSGPVQDVDLISLKVMRVLSTSNNVLYGLECDSCVLEAYYYILNNFDGPIIAGASFGGPGWSELLQEVITAGRDKMLVFASAGNTKSEIVQYPAGYDDVFGVVALEKDGTLAQFSSWGRRNKLGAPGVAILSTSRNGEYKMWRGTSAARPAADGVVALLLSGLVQKFPNLTVPEMIALVREAIIQGARYNPNLVGKIPNPVEVDALGAWEWLKAQLQEPEPEPQPEPEPDIRPRPDRIFHHRHRSSQ